MYKPTQSVAAVPLWLAAIVDEQNLEIDCLVSFNKLSSILSVTDVCLYANYVEQTNLYTDAIFDDMMNINSIPENVLWVANHVSEMQKAKEQFQTALLEAGDNIIDTIDDVVRKVKYRPKAVNENILLLIGHEQSETIPYDYEGYLSNCIAQLAKQMRFSEYRTFNVFAHCLGNIN